MYPLCCGYKSSALAARGVSRLQRVKVCVMHRMRAQELGAGSMRWVRAIGPRASHRVYALRSMGGIHPVILRARACVIGRRLALRCMCLLMFATVCFVFVLFDVRQSEIFDRIIAVGNIWDSFT
jgi:hypothetical protein